ncbi:MAG: hypothetical protein ACK5FT_03885 [Sphingomonadales bacterium]|jgi:hypothetical protein
MMKKVYLILFLLLSVGLASLHSCGKYEEGPGFSLRSKKSRVVNTWVIDKYLINGNDVTAIFLAAYGEHALLFKSDDSYEFNTVPGRKTGTWSFDSNKESLEFQESGTATKYDQKIMRLTANEMWLWEDDGTDKIEVHYKTKSPM